MWKLVLIAAGGALGSVLRFLLAGWVQAWAGWGEPHFPVGTLAVNTTGCFGIGLLGALFAGPLPVREEYSLALIVGVLGGFTTFSTFGRDTFALAGGGQLGAAAANLILSNGAGLLAIWLGHTLARHLGA